MDTYRAITVTALMFVMGCTQKVRKLDPNELSAANSVFGESREERDIVWAIIQARFSTPSSATGGFCATAWLITISPDQVVFATAAHTITDDLFKPKQPNLFTKVWLSDGTRTIPISAANRVVAGNDVAFLVIPRSEIPDADTMRPLKLDLLQSPIGKKIINLGFPDRGNAANTIHISSEGVSFDNGPWFQSGTVLKKVRKNINADVKMKDGELYVLDYTSEKGFSGGPLFVSGSDLVVGMMSFVIPNGDSVPVQAAAITAGEISLQKHYVP